MRATAFALLLGLATVPAAAADWVAGDGSTLGFSATYEGDAVPGGFSRFSARVDFDPAAPASCRFVVDIDLASVAIDIDDDGTLQGDDFFAIARFPKATWTASACRALGDGRFIASGELTLRGVTRPAPLTFTWTAGPTPSLQGEASVQRLAHDVGAGDWSDTGLLADAVQVRTVLKLAAAQ